MNRFPATAGSSRSPARSVRLHWGLHPPASSWTSPRQRCPRVVRTWPGNAQSPRPVAPSPGWEGWHSVESSIVNLTFVNLYSTFIGGLTCQVYYRNHHHRITWHVNVCHRSSSGLVWKWWESLKDLMVKVTHPMELSISGPIGPMFRPASRRKLREP